MPGDPAVRVLERALNGRRLPSIAYDRGDEPSLFDRWEAGDDSAFPPPLAVRDPTYRRLVVSLLASHAGSGTRLMSVGAGNGYVEADLAADGWDVLATDRSESALRHCRDKNLRTALFTLTQQEPPGTFDGVYCDGVMGHLWDSATGAARAWSSLAEATRPGGLALVSNDLSDDDAVANFRVRTSAAARFYRPPRATFAAAARRTERWSIELQQIYEYARAGTPRRRELILARHWCTTG